MRRGDDHLRQNYITSHEPVSQFLARHINRARDEAQAEALPIVPHATQEQLAAIAAELAEFWASFPDGIVPRRALRQKVEEIKEKYGTSSGT